MIANKKAVSKWRYSNQLDTPWRASL